MTYDPALEDTLGRAPRLPPGSADPTLAVVVARLDDLRESVAELRVELRSSTANVVPRGEWEQRNRAVDARFEGQGREIAILRTDIVQARTIAEQRRPAWPVILAAVVSVISVAVVLIQSIGS